MMSNASVGIFRSGLPYNRFGRGPRPLVIIQGLTFENKPLPWLALRMYDFLREDYTVYSVVRKQGLPPGYTLGDMAGDCATMIRDEFTGPVDVIGISTGGSIAQPFAAEHPELVHRLVIHSSAYKMSHAGRAALMDTGRLASQHKWREAWATLLSFSLSAGPFRRPQAWLASFIMSLDAPDDPVRLRGSPGRDQSADSCGGRRSRPILHT
jgi:pimeloyl-ACP methyl ester carboxylesterase